MATKKTTKKAPVKKVAAKKPVAKKTVAKKTTKPVEVVTPVIHECPCGGHCTCGCHGRFWKKFLILVIVFALGGVCAMYFYKPHMPKHHIKFDDNGCLISESVKCPKMLEALAAADVDMNGCITREEMHAMKKAMHKAK